MLCHHGFLSICTCTCMSTMDVFIKVILFSYVLYTMFTTIQSAEQTFFKEDLTWIEAQRCCASKSGQLATIDDNDNTVSCHNIPNESTDLKIWTGKNRRHSEWIEYLGCFLTYGEIVHVPHISECYQKCLDKQQYFAFKRTVCICKPSISNNITSLPVKCTVDEDNHFLWLYKVLYNASFDGYGNCVASKCISGSHKRVAERCASSQMPMCVDSVPDVSARSKASNWTESQRNCKLSNFQAKNATDMCERKRGSTETGMWTNIFRVEISSHSDYAKKINISEISSCMIAQCASYGQTITYRYSDCTETGDGFFCKSVDNSTMLSQADYIRQTTNVHNTSQSHSIGETTVSSSISTFTRRTQHHHSTEIRKTVDKASIRSADIITTLKPPVRSSTILTTTDQHVTYKTDASTIGIVCGVTVGGVVVIAAIIIITCKYRNVGPFRKRPYNEDTIEMNNSIDCAIPEYHDTVLITGNGSVPKDAIRNITAENPSNVERQNKTYFSNHEYAVVAKKHTVGPTVQPRGLDLEEDDNKSQRVETEDEYDTLKHTVDKGEEQIENNVYDSSLGICDGVDPTYNSIKIGQVNNDTTYDHTSNIVQKKVNIDTTYDHTSSIVQKQVNNETTYDHTF